MERRETKFGINAKVQLTDKNHELYGVTGRVVNIGEDEKHTMFVYAVLFKFQGTEVPMVVPEHFLDRVGSVILLPNGVAHAIKR